MASMSGQLADVRSGRRKTPRVVRRRRFGLTLLALVLAVAAFGCGSDSSSETGSSPDTAAPQPGGRLVVGVPVPEPDTLLYILFEPLTTFDSEGNVVPFLAESVEPNENFDRWTIKVRPGITFRNGQPLDANAVKANLDTYSVSELYTTDPLAPIVATNVVDDLTVEVELEQPWASFPAALTAEQSGGTGLIAAPATIETSGPLFLADPTDPQAFGTGPFIYTGEAGAVDQWTLERNPDYWQEGLPYLDELEIRVVPEATTRMADLEAGDLDVAITDKAPADDGTYQILTQPGDPEVLAIALNTGRPPLDDPSLREALAAATDVETLAATAGVDPSLIAAGPFGPGSPWSDPEASPVAYDSDRARELVAAYEAANGPVSIELSAQDLEIESLAVQQQIAQQWTDAGIDVQIDVIDPLEQTATLLIRGDYDAVLENVFGMPDPDMYYFWWHSSALRGEGKGIGYNYTGIDDDELDAALDEARATDDDEVRREAMVTVQERLSALSPYLWLWGTSWTAVSNPRVAGLGIAPLPDGGTRWPMLGRGPNYEGTWIEQ